MKVNYSVATYFDNRAVNNETKESRVMLRIQLSNGAKFMTVIKGFRCTLEDYEKSFLPKSISDVQREIKDRVDAEILKADTILKRLGEMATKYLFLKYYRNDIITSTHKTDVYQIMDEMMVEMKAENRFGSASMMYNAKNSFKMYKAKFYLEDIDEKFIKDYRTFMFAKGLSISTVGIYVRTLRSIYTACVKEGLIQVKTNPFENVSVAYTVASKSVLYPEQLKALWEYQPVTPNETKAKDFFFFCYLCNGMNFKDVAELRVKHFKNDMIVFIRQKTKGTQTEPKEVMVYLNDEIRRVMNLYGSHSTNPNDYLFAMFNKCKSLKHHNATFIRHKRTCNKELNKIGVKLNCKTRIYLGIARHSFATKHKLDGTPTSFVSEFMGHSNQRTTENYMKTLPSNMMKDANSKLLDFSVNQS